MVHQSFKMSLSKTNNSDTVLQEKYLREITQHFRGIPKPLKYGPKIDTLSDLIESLYNAFETNYVNIELVNHIMLAYISNSKEWHKYAKFDRFKYTRNLVDAGNGKFNLMILCWGEGQSSAIHDHSASHCFMKILKGELLETRYEWPSLSIENTCNGTSICSINNADIGQALKEDDSKVLESSELKEIGCSTMSMNEVAYINDTIGLHRVENPSHVETAVSLHLYCPPFNECSVFQKNSGKKITCPVTFWSKYGVREATITD